MQLGWGGYSLRTEPRALDTSRAPDDRAPITAVSFSRVRPLGVSYSAVASQHPLAAHRRGTSDKTAASSDPGPTTLGAVPWSWHPRNAQSNLSPDSSPQRRPQTRLERLPLFVMLYGS